MNISQLRRLIVAVLVAAVLGSAIPAGIAGAIEPPREATDAGHLAPTSKVFELFARVFNGTDATAAERLIADDAVLHTPYGDYVGPEGVNTYVALVRRSYLDADFAIADIETYGNTAKVTWVMTAAGIQTDPSGPAAIADVTVTGELTIVATDAELTDLTQVHETIAITTPGVFVASHGPLE